MIKVTHKELVLLSLIERLYSGNTEMVSQLKNYLESKGIPDEFHFYL